MIHGIVEKLWAAGIYSILDLHQDILSPRICGEGLPDWMVNVSTIGAREWPFPLRLKGTARPDPVSGAYTPPVDCAPFGPAKFIGWSEFYMTDACGKTFHQIYANDAPLGPMFESFWDEVSRRFQGDPLTLTLTLTLIG